MSAESERQESAPLPADILLWQLPSWRVMIDRFSKGQLAHAYLVSGDQGIGKLLFLRQLARYMLCLEPQEILPCGKCVNCRVGQYGYHPDIILIQPEEDARDIKIAQIRGLMEFIARTGHSGKAKIIIINHANHLNISAANSLLKTLEEPSPGTYLFLAASKADSLSATLRSRCQRLLLPTPSLTETEQWLSEQGIPADQAPTLAAASGSRPFHALFLASAAGMATASDFFRSLVALAQERIHVNNAVAIAVKTGEQVSVEYLLRASSIIIKSLLTHEMPKDAVMGELFKSYLDFQDKVFLLKNLLRFNQSAEEAMRQLQGVSNPNAQLLLESLMWQWSQLRAALPESSAAFAAK